MSKQYDLKSVAVGELLDDLFEYLLKLDGKDQLDEAIQTDELILNPLPEYEGDRTDKLIIRKIDDSEKTSYNKLYFNGEGDSNQTRYEHLSNHLKIATTAKNDKVGKCLHTFLRQIIDNYSMDWFMESYEFVTQKKPINGKEVEGIFTLDEIVNILEESVDTYGQTFDIRKDGIYAECELSGYDKNHIYRKTQIKRFVGDIDIWNIYRIGHALGVWNDNEKYENLPN